MLFCFATNLFHLWSWPRLHMQVISDAEAAAAARQELAEHATKLQNQNTDLRFISSKQV